MLSPSDYIKKELEAMSDKFIGFKIKYAFDTRMDSHIIQVINREDFLNTEELANWEYDFIDRFREIYADEEVIISEPCKFHRLGETLYENNGAAHVKPLLHGEFLTYSMCLTIQPFSSIKKRSRHVACHNESINRNKDIYVW